MLVYRSLRLINRNMIGMDYKVDQLKIAKCFVSEACH